MQNAQRRLGSRSKIMWIKCQQHGLLLLLTSPNLFDEGGRGTSGQEWQDSHFPAIFEDGCRFWQVAHFIVTTFYKNLGAKRFNQSFGGPFLERNHRIHRLEGE